MKKLLPFLFALAVALAGCSGSTATADAELRGVEPLPQGRWTELAHQLVAADDLATATRLTREILARGGMPTTDGERIVVPAIGPATPYQMTALEARNLAIEARNRETAFRLHASEFANFLDAFALDLGGRRDEPAWLTKDELRAQYEEALSRVDAAYEAAFADGEAEVQALAARIPALEVARAEASQALRDAQAAVHAVPPSERRPLHAKAKAARSESIAANRALRSARQALEDGEDDRRGRANRAKQDAHREFAAWNQVRPNYDAGHALLRLLDTWVREAAKHPEDPESFTPLFLAEMARLQQAPFDLLGSRYVRPSRGTTVPVDLRGVPRPDDYRLTLLEMQLFLAAFQRGQPAASTTPRTASVPSRLATGVADFLLPPAHATSMSACDDLKRMMGGDSPGATDWAANEAANKAWQAYGSLLGFSDAALARISGASKILRVVIQYANTEARVDAEQGVVHKPPSDTSEGHGTRYAWFTASAGVDPEDLEDYERELEEQEAQSEEILNRCFGSLELPSLQSLGELADAAENWRVQWEIRPLHPKHLSIPMRDPDNKFVKITSVAREMKLERASPAHAEAKLKARVVNEEAVKGEVALVHHTVVAKVVDTGTPGFSEMVNAVKGIFGMGMGDIVVDLAAGWMKHILVPRASALQPIEYHCLDQEFVRRATRPVADGVRAPRTRDHCVLPAEAE
ncbi:hypothetical protein [Luteimonas lutimaris]|uniref:Uncharacterized protein n=1 Tax=Luteimonas lutimaris TaxID=698645 RepID=A0ABP7MRD7_9GAMM